MSSSSCSSAKSAIIKTDFCIMDVSEMKQKASDHYLIVYIHKQWPNSGPFPVNCFLSNDFKFKYFTRLTNYKLLSTGFEYIIIRA